jgi:hypothetical protein
MRPAGNTPAGSSCSPTPARGPNRLDAQIRVGGDAGASEVIVLRGFGQLAEESESLVAALLLPDAPIVAWWPHGAPENACETSIGRIAHRRITDSANEAEPQVGAGEHPEHVQGRRHRPRLDPADELAHPARRGPGPG